MSDQVRANALTALQLLGADRGGVQNVNGGVINTPQTSPLEIFQAVNKATQDATKAETALAKAQQSSETKNEPVKLYKGAPGEKIHIPLPSEYLPSGWQYGAGVGALASAGRLISDFFRPDSSDYSINADGDVVNSHGIVQPKGSSRTEAIRQQLLTPKTEPQAQETAQTSSQSQTPALEEAGKVSGSTDDSQKTKDGVLNAQDPDVLQMRDLDAQIDDLTNGYGYMNGDQIARWKNAFDTKTHKIHEEMGKAYKDWGGLGALKRVSEHVLKDSTVEEMTNEYLEGQKHFNVNAGDEKSKNGPNFAAALNKKIYDIAAKYDLHPALAASVVFRGIDEGDWSDSHSVFGINKNTSFDNDTIEKLAQKAKDQGDLIDSAFQNYITMQQQQNLVDNYYKQLADGVTTQTRQVDLFNSLSPETSGYKLFKAGLEDSAHGLKTASLNYANAIKQYLSLSPITLNKGQK